MGDIYHPLTPTGVQKWFIEKSKNIKQSAKKRDIAAQLEVLPSHAVEESSEDVIVFGSYGGTSAGMQKFKRMMSDKGLFDADERKDLAGGVISSLTDQFSMIVSKRPDGKYEKLGEEGIRSRVHGMIEYKIKKQKREEHLEQQPPKSQDELSDIDIAYSKGRGTDLSELAGNIEMKANAMDNLKIWYFNPHIVKYLYEQHKEMGGKVYEEEDGEFREVNDERGMKYVS